MLAASAARAGFDHAPFDAVLKEFVDDKGLVSYETLLQKRQGLDAYVASLGAVTAEQLNSWPREEQVALYINAYNALAIKRVLDHYPPKSWSKLSIKNIGGALNKIKDPIAGDEVTLDKIENEILRGKYKEPMALFAISRATMGSPKLSREAYRGDSLAKQLERATMDFVRDKDFVHVETDKMRVTISPIFEWYGADLAPFEAELSEVKNNPSVKAKLKGAIAFISKYSPSRIQDYILRADYKLYVGDYDWALNAK